MTKPEGAVGLVLPAKLFGARYAERMRSDLEQRHTLLALDDRSTDTLFAADAYPALLFARPGGRSSEVVADGVGARARCHSQATARPQRAMHPIIMLVAARRTE